MKINNNEICDYIAKVVVIGESSVGKTNILSRFSKNEFSIETKSTIGVEFLTNISEIKGKRIKLQIWDTAGQEKYKAITNSFYCNSNAALIVFDLSSKESFERIDYWVKEVKKYTREDIILILIGNKSDLERQISFELGSEKAEKLSKRKAKLDVDYYETSALLNKNITEVFDKLCINIIEKQMATLDNEDFRESFQLNERDSQKSMVDDDKNKRKCC